MQLRFTSSVASLAAALLMTSWASAEPLRVHASGVAARALKGHQEREFSWGVGLLPALELPMTASLGLQFELGAIWLSEGSAPLNPNVEPLGDGSALSAGAGVRFRPFATSHDGTPLSPAGFWLAGAFGLASTGSLARPIFDLQIGYDFMDRRGRAGLGPMLGYYHVFQPDSESRPADASLLLFGLHAVFDFGRGIRLMSDRDRDGVYDEDDKCPEAPEDLDKVEDADGCPDLDDDRDGIEDVRDRCPIVPEDKDGFEDDDGCPEHDNDKDAILDAKDQCPDVAEDRDTYQDEDGCPDPDNDGDGVPDISDLCPFEKETVNDYADSDGCPDEDQVRVTGDKIVLDDRVHFNVNSDVIRQDSWALLGRLAKLVKEHPEYEHISIEGHADERGADDLNQRLSEGRASSVLEFLAKAGVPRGRLSSKGFGASRPLVEKKSELAYYQNRRVEFIITRQARGNVPGATLPPKPDSVGQDGPLPPDVPIQSEPAKPAPRAAAPKPAPPPAATPKPAPPVAAPKPAPPPPPKPPSAPPSGPNAAPPKSPAPPAGGNAGQAAPKGAQP